MYGSEAVKDFADYAEKASTKSLGRALLALGYGTAFASEMDEGERVVDSPVERRAQPLRVRAAPEAPVPHTVREAPAAAAAAAPAASADGAPPATEQQLTSIRKLCEVLGKPEPAAGLNYAQARELITQLSSEYQRHRRAS